jgi:MFS family permease
LIGSFTGLLIIGYMSDKFGRKLALLISIFFILVSIIFTLIGGHFNIITLLFMG